MKASIPAKCTSLCIVVCLSVSRNPLSWDQPPSNGCQRNGECSDIEKKSHSKFPWAGTCSTFIEWLIGVILWTYGVGKWVLSATQIYIYCKISVNKILVNSSNNGSGNSKMSLLLFE